MRPTQETNGSARGGLSERSTGVERAVNLMELLADGRSRSVADSAAALGVSRQVVYRMVASLSERGWVRRHEDGRISMGLAVLRLGAGVFPLLRELASPILRSLAEKADATAHMTIAEGAHARALIVIEPTWKDWHVSYRVGSSHSLSKGAAGRAIVTARDGDFTPVVSESELQPGAIGVASAIDSPGIEASVGVIALGDLETMRAASLVAQAARAVGSALAER